ncbi:MAG: hypothetical protein QMC36_05275, partial [Patescibacteria group bacterium]
VYDRAAYQRKKQRGRTISENVTTIAPVTVPMKQTDLEKLTRKELQKLVLMSRQGVNVPIQLNLRTESSSEQAPKYDLQNEKEAVF